MHKIDTKDSGSLNFSFLDVKVTSVASRQISSNNGGNGAWQTDFFIAHKKSQNHIQNVASKNTKTLNSMFFHLKWLLDVQSLMLVHK
jgi:hypothetical protein